MHNYGTDIAHINRKRFSMKESIDWLVHLDNMAERVYGKAAAFFPDDREFSEFLLQLARGEALQRQIIGRFAECVTGNENGHASLISLKEDTKKDIESPLLECGKKVEGGKITREELLEYIIAYEYSEWNDILLYLVDTFKECSRDFAPVAVRIHQHRRNIERYAELHPGLKISIEKKRNLRPLWEENLLVIDDYEAIVRLFSSVLEKEGKVEGASNGLTALKKMGEKYYSVIIVDVGMPLMNGIEFYNKASRIYPNIKERTLFYTSADDKESISFFRKNNLKYLIKPGDINEIKRTVGTILNR